MKKINEDNNSSSTNNQNGVKISASKDELTDVINKTSNVNKPVSINITSENDESTSKVNYSEILKSFGIILKDKSEKDKSELKGIIRGVLDLLKNKGFTTCALSEEEEKADREIAHGGYGSEDEYDFYEKYNNGEIKEESFDNLMNDLKENGAPLINVNENINPRIKKSDLVSYFKNKK